MKSTHLTLLKFRCDKRDCEFEFYVNKNNNLLMHYNANMSALLEWPCPECKSGHLRYAPTNAKYEYHLVKKERPEAQGEPGEAEAETDSEGAGAGGA